MIWDRKFPKLASDFSFNHFDTDCCVDHHTASARALHGGRFKKALFCDGQHCGPD
jgi:hypothetical protein